MDAHDSFRHRTAFEDVWRYLAPSGGEAAGAQLKPLTKLQKLEAVVKARLPRALSSETSQALCAGLLQRIEKWSKARPPK